MGCRLWASAATAAVLLLGPGGAASPVAAQQVYTIANYPVEATADNAVTAKERALSDGRQAALRSLLKRIVPATAYKQLTEAKAAKATDLIDGVVVRSERNSSTQYLANLDFSFHPKAVRDLLQRYGIPYVDTQAPELILIPIYVPPGAGQGPVPADLSPPRGSRTWTDAWSGLDLDHALTPIRLSQLKEGIGAQTVNALKDGDGDALVSVTRSFASDRVIVAFAEPDLGNKRLNVTLAGRDAVGAFVLKRSWRLALDDVSYAAELAAVVALGTLEGRWKAVQGGMASGGARLSGGMTPVHLYVEFRNMREWQDVRQRLAQVPGLEDFEVGGISARGADVDAAYPGGPEALTAALGRIGFDARQVGDTVQVRPAF